jgi:diacylglycerol kinase (ATP)
MVELLAERLKRVMADRRYLLIANPVSGKGKSVEQSQRVARQLKEAGVQSTLVESQYPGHIVELVAACDPEAYAGICITGGDGSVRECATGLQQHPHGERLVVGLVGGGTGNSIHRELGLQDVDTCVSMILAGRPTPMDVLRVDADQQTFFGVNLVGWGAAASIGARAESMRWLGRSRYAVATLVEVAWAKIRSVELVHENRIIAESAFLILGCNTKHGGWQMRLAPQASLFDGLVDLTVVQQATRRQLLQLFSKVYSGKHVDQRAVQYLQVPRFSMLADEPQRLNLDGDVVDGRFCRVEVSVVPSGMKVYQ